MRRNPNGLILPRDAFGQNWLALLLGEKRKPWKDENHTGFGDMYWVSIKADGLRAGARV